jgi:class 3 adenylate cyclase
VSRATFEPNQTYDNVFLLFIDAAGHSSLVADNPADVVYRAMDLLHDRLVDRLAGAAQRHRCARAQLWRWAGDGGLLVVHDEEESHARDTALDFVRKVLEIDLGHLRDEFADLGIRGELRLRLGIHRGTIRYRGEGLEGSIYSGHLNYAAHLEKVAPPDCAAVSAEVRQVAGDFADQLEHVGSYENRPVYLFAPGTKAGSARRLWLAAQGMAGSVRVAAVDERPSQQEKVRLVEAAEDEVISLGMSLRTGAHYLVTTERPAYYRDAVLTLLRSGGRYRCVLMDPRAEATRMLAEQRGEPLPARIDQALADLRRFKEQAGAVGAGLEVHLTSRYPGMSCLAADLDGPDGVMLVSPYLSAPPGSVPPGSLPPGSLPIERGDMPHYLLGPTAGRLYEKLRGYVLAFARTDTERVL